MIAPGSRIETSISDGTIAAIVMGDDRQPLAMSAGHVLVGHGTPAFCPDRVSGVQIGEVIDACDNPLLDGAVSSINGVLPNAAVLGLGVTLSATARPAVGNRVAKFGHATQRTDGVVTAINRTRTVNLGSLGSIRVRGFIIDPLPNSNPANRLSAQGDSGAPWVLTDNAGRPLPILLGIHVAGGQASGGSASPFAFACLADEVMADLGVSLWQPDLAQPLPFMALPGLRPAVPMLVATEEPAILRGLPRETAARLGGLEPGQLVHVLAVKDGWAKISLKGNGRIDGFVWEDLLVALA